MVFLLKVFAIDTKFRNTGTHAHPPEGMCLRSTSAHPLHAGLDKHSMPLMGLARVLILD